MIDWPNALTGFFFGVLTTLMFWIPDRIHAGRQRRDELWESWKVAMSDVELLTWKGQTRAYDIHVARSRYPLDLWRSVLTEREGFKLLERLELAYSSVEYFASQLAANTSDENSARFTRAEAERNAARVAFANYSRNAQSKGYAQLVQQEEREENIRDFFRNPVRSVRGLRHAARLRKTRR